MRRIGMLFAVVGLAAGSATLPGAAIVAPPESWTVGQPMLPADAAGPGGATANAVDCASNTFCVVVGSYWPAGADEPTPYVATLRGSTWTSVRAPLPGDSPSAKLISPPTLADVSCSAVGSCVAVGSGANGSEPIIVTLAGGHWTAAAVAGASGASLDQVACGAAECVAVGQTDPFSPSDPLFVDRVGGTWRVRALSTPATQPNTPPTVTGVACFDTGCRAVGANDDGALRYRRIAGRWTGHYLPMPVGTMSGALSGGAISCAAAQHCVALVPNVNDGSGGLVAETLTSGGWHPSAISLRPALSGRLSSVAIDCPAVDRCAGSATVAVGASRTGGLVVWLSAGAWTAASAPAPADAAANADVTLADVSCQSDVACTAVGSYVTKVDDRRVRRPLVETLSGGSWTATGLGLPDGVVAKENSVLTGVSCVAPRCAAVGWYAKPGSALPTGGVVAVAHHAPGS